MSKFNPKSILTSAMETAAAKKAAKETGEEIVLTDEELAAKRSLRNARIFLAGTAALFVTTMVVIAKMKDETEENDDVENTTDED